MRNKNSIFIGFRSAGNKAARGVRRTEMIIITKIMIMMIRACALCFDASVPAPTRPLPRLALAAEGPAIERLQHFWLVNRGFSRSMRPRPFSEIRAGT